MTTHNLETNTHLLFVAPKMADARQFFVLLSRRKTLTEISDTLGYSCFMVYRDMERGAFEKDPGVRSRPQRSEYLILELEEAIGKVRVCVTKRGLEKDFNVPKATMTYLVKEDLGLKGFKRSPRMFLSDDNKNKPLERAQILLNELKDKHLVLR